MTTYTNRLLSDHTGPNAYVQLPVIPQSNTTVIARYLCTELRLKPTASLLASVFASTSTMVLTVWGVWKIFATMMAVRLGAKMVRSDSLIGITGAWSLWYFLIYTFVG